MSKVLELLDTPEKWTQGAAARDIEGKPIKATSYHAVSWSLLGALDRVVHPVHFQKVYQQYVLNVMNKGYINLSQWNDTTGRTYADVVALIHEVEEG